MIDVILPRNHPAQARIEAESRRFNVICAGRRFGKDIFLNRRIIKKALTARQPVAFFAPTYKMLLENWRTLRNLLMPVTARASDSEHRIDLITGNPVEMWSLDNPDSARGRYYAYVAINEAAMIPNLMNIWNTVIRPMLADLEGEADFGSTPKGMNGFRQLWQLGQDNSQLEWASWQFPTFANPYIKPAEIEAMRVTMPERIFQQEIMAVFLDDAGGVFRCVMDAATATEQARAITFQQDGRSWMHSYVIGVDWAKQNDFTVLTVLDTDTREVVTLDRFNQIDYAVQIGRLRALYERFHPVTIIAERNSIGDPLIEQLLREGLPVQPFNTTQASKAQVIDGLALAFERGDIRILPDPVLIAELQAYEAERLPSGMLRYNAPEGMHDDCVMSLALAWAGIGQQVTAVTNPFSDW